MASLQTQIDNLIPSQTGNAGKFLTTNGSALSWSSVAGGLSYQGTWNASTNTPTLTSSVGVNGYYYIVATAGSTNLNGITDWQIGDWLLFNGTVWQKLDQTNLVISVNGQTGAVVLTTTNISEGTNQYYLDSRARSAISAGTGISYNSSTGVVTNSAPDQTVALTGGTGISTSGTYPSFTITNSAPDQTVALTGAGTTSITGTYPNFTITSNDQYAGTVTSVGGTGTVNGISLSGTVTSSGNLTLGGTLSGVSLSTQVSGTLPIANGGTGQTTAVAAFDALAPTTTKGDLIVNDGSDNVRLAVGTNNYVLTADSAQATGVKWATVAAGTTVSDDTTTNATYYPTFSTATSGTYSVATVSSTKLTYNPSLGDLTATQLAASNGIMFTNQTVSTSVTFPTGYEGISGKNTTIASGVTVTVPSGANWTIV